MRQIKLKWNKISPADLSSTCCAQYYAFAKQNTILHIDNVNNKCLFTTVIQATANLSVSIYDLEIWVGYITEGANLLNTNFDPEDVMDLLEWSAKSQLGNLSLLEEQVHERITFRA